MMISKRTSSSRNSFSEEESDHDENFFVKKKVSTTRKKSYKKWAKEEDERLKEFINTHHGLLDWSRISQYVSNGRTDAQCQHRWERFLDPSITKGPWTDEEDKKVIELVRDYGARQWSLIAKELKGRVGKQCRERWHNHLNPAINKNPWTNEENLLLFVLHQHFGNKWAEIAKYFNGRSDNSIKNHWNSSMKKKFEIEVENLNKQGLHWTTLIPSDFPWPKLEKAATTASSSSSSRAPLGSITNTKAISEEKATTNSEKPTAPDQPMNYYPEPSSQPTSSQRSSQDLERLFYCTPPSPIKPLPMLSSCADYTSSSQNSQQYSSLYPSSLEFYPSSNRTTLFSSQETFSLSFTHSQNELKQENDQHILIDIPSQQTIVSPKTNSNHSSPSKYRVLNTPERPDRPHRSHLSEHDWLNELLSDSDPITTVPSSNQSLNTKRLTKSRSTKKRLFSSSQTLKNQLGYEPTYTEILIGQTRDQRYVTEQARRYLSSSSSLYLYH